MERVIMTSTTIKEQFTARGIKFKDLAAELGVSKTSVSLVVNGKSVSDRVQRAIASRLGKDPEQVFPEYYQRKRKITKPDEDEKQAI